MFRSIRSLLGICGHKKSVPNPSKFFKNVRLKLEALEDRTVPAVDLAYVNNAWSGFINGQVIINPDPTVSGEPDAVFGTNAFATVQGGADNVTSGGTVTLLPGAYPGNVAMSNPFILNVLPGNSTISGNVSGAPGLQIGKTGLTGTGTLTLSGVNTYNGNTIVARGRLQISNDNQLGSLSGVVSVTTPGALEITGNMTSSRTIALQNATLQVDGGKTLALSGGEIDGGSLTGPGTIATIDLVPTSFNGVRSTPSLTLKAKTNANFNSFDNGGTLELAATKTFTLTSFTNTSSGKMFVNGTANVTDFVSNGVITVGPNGKIVNVGSSGLNFGGGSNTTVNRLGIVDNVNDGLIDIGSSNATLAGGLLTNNGLVGSFTGASLIVDFGGNSQGTGQYGSIISQNGGVIGTGGSGVPNIDAVIGGVSTGSVQKNGTVTASGTLTVTDANPGQSSFQSNADLTSFGSFTVTSGGTWVYTLNNASPAVQALLAGATLVDTFTVLSFDGTPKLVSITITGAPAPNSVPVAQTNTVTTNVNVAYTFAASDFHYTDVENDPLVSITIGTKNLALGDTLKLSGADVANGQTIPIAQIPNLVFTPAANQSGPARSTFTFTANDAGLGTLAATININVTPANSVPVAQASSVTMIEDTAAFTFAVTNFLFTDAENNPLASITVGNQILAAGDTLKLNGVSVTNGQTITAAQIPNLVYKPAADGNGAPRSTFTFTANDLGLGTLAATMSINVTPVNDVPVAAPSNVSTNINVPKTFAPSNFQFTDAEGDSLVSITIVNQNLATGDTLKLAGTDVANGQTIAAAQIPLLVYTPFVNAQGLARSAFTFTVNDSGIGTIPATMSISVSSGTNFAPVLTTTGSPLSYSENAAPTAVDTSLTLVDVDNLTLANLTASITGNFSLGDALSYTDPTGGKVDGAVSGNGQTLTLSAHPGQLPTIAQFQSAARAISYASSSDNPSTLTRTVTFTANDGSATNNIGTALRNIAVTSFNDAPIAGASSVVTLEDTPYTFAVSNFNFFDPEGNSLSSITIGTRNLAVADSIKLNGVEVVNGQTIPVAQIPNLVYTPRANLNGNAVSTFTFTANDADLGTLASTMTINVIPVPDVPVALASSVTTNEDTPKTFAASDFLISNPDGNNLSSITISNLSLASGDTLLLSGSLVFNGQTITVAQIPNLVYTPAANVSGTPRSAFSFTANDVSLGTVAATMSINVTPVNDLPVATASSVVTVEDTSGFTFTASNFQFIDLEGDNLASITVGALNLASGDTLKLNGVDVAANQTIPAAQIPSLVYKPAANGNGSSRSTFTFTANDAGLGTAAATMSITVLGVNDVPVATASSVTTNKNTSYSFSANDFKFNDADFTGTPPASNISSVTLTGVSLAAGDTLLFSGVSVGSVPFTLPLTIAAIQLPGLVYTPAVNQSGLGRSTFTFLVNDSESGTQAAAMTINVVAFNGLPLAQTSNVTTNEDSAYAFAASDFKFTDPENDNLASITVGTLNLAPGDTLKLGTGTDAVPVTSTLTISAAQIPTLVYTPAANQNGISRSTFTFTVNDQGPGTGVQSATMFINVTAVNDLPTAQTSTVTAFEATPKAFAVSDFLFTDVENNSLASVTIGSVSLSPGDTLKLGTAPVTNGQTITAAQIPTLVYTSAGNGIAHATFTFTVNDAGLGTIAATMFINVTAVAHTPQVANITTLEDTQSGVIVIQRNPADGPEITNFKISGITNGTLFQADGVTPIANNAFITSAQGLAGVKFTPAANTNLAGSFSVQSSLDGTTVIPLSGTAISTITIVPVNDVPVATASTVTATRNTPLVFSAANFTFTDQEGDSLSSITFKALNLAAGDTLTFGGAPVIVGQTIAAALIPAIVYTPAANQIGAARSTFSFTVNDAAGSGTVAATMTINVIVPNAPPVATSSAVTTGKNAPYTFATTDFHFTDAEGDSLVSITIGGLTLSGGDTLKLGTASVASGQTITAAQIPTLVYTPALDQTGNPRSAFGFTVNDVGNGVVGATMTISVTQNTPPVASASSVTTNEDTAKTFAASDFLFTDVDGDSLTSITVATLALASGDTLKLGTVTVAAGQTIPAAQIPTLVYTPAANGNGAARSTFTFKVNDLGIGVVAATMTINVTAVNDVPVATASSVTTNEDTAKTFAVSDFSFTDPESNALVSITVGTLTLASGDTLRLGTAAVTAGQTITAAQIPTLVYTPAADANGAARSTFTFTANDAGNGTVSATMSINVTAVNDVPVATASSATTNEDTVFTFAVSDFKFTDAETNALVSVTVGTLTLASGDTLRLGTAAVTTGQTITAAQIPTLVYTPAANANGAARSTFTFTANDAGNGTVSATMTLNVTAVNDVPVATASSVTTNEDTVYTFTAADFKFTDVESNALVSITVGTLNLAAGDTLKLGTATVTNGQTIVAPLLTSPGLVYTPAANGNGAARSTFTFTVNDAGNGTASATMSINVTAVPDAPVATAGALSLVLNTPVTSTLPASDPDGGSLTFSIVDQTNAHGTVTITNAATGAYSYTPAPNYVGPASFTFKANDGTSDSNVATITITVTTGTYLVDSAADVNDGDFSAGHLSLREAVARANVTQGAETITFLAGLGPIDLTLGTLALTDTTGLTKIVGLPNSTQIVRRSSAAGTASFSIFRVDTGASAELRNLTISGGIAAAASGLGGGLTNSGTTKIVNSTISGNSAEFGGGVHNEAGNLTIVSSLITGNQATDGGGLWNKASLTLVNDTVSSNTASGFGGGVRNSGAGILAMTNDTIVLNRADSDSAGAETGGGISSASTGGSALRNTIVAGNVKGTGTTADDVTFSAGSLSAVSSTSNLIGDAATAGGLANGSAGNIVGINGTGTIAITSILSTTLADNGGPTKTHALVQNSPALQGGSDAVLGYSPFDQRDAARDLTTPDIGAYEVNHPLAPVGVPSDNSYVFGPQPSVDANTAYIKGLYHSTLFREASASDISFWVAKITVEHVPLTQIAYSFINSTENRTNQVTYFYRYFLHREPDAQGLALSVARLQSGVDEGTVMADFILSPEFSGQNDNTSFVNLMYYTILSHPADTAGLNFWLNQLQTGAMNRGQVVNAFLRSPEGIGRVVNSYFQSYLKRPADAGAMNSFKVALASGTTFGAVAASILGSTEYFGLATANK